MNKPVYLGFLILESSKTLMYEIWYDYIKPKYQTNAKLCYIDTDSFIIQIKRPFWRGMNKKAIELIKDNLGGRVMIELVALRPKTYSSFKDDGDRIEKIKVTERCVIKIILKFNHYNDCLLNNEPILQS